MLVADRYRLETSIGRGGMGEVWRASDEVLGRQVAVKLLLGGDTDPSAAARFQLEARTAARLSHPHLVAVYDFGAWQDRFFLVMELVEGTSLAQALTSEGRLSPERVAHIATQAAAGLAAAHRQGVVHRDIKPGNLMVDTEGTVKIGDFGIARFVDDPGAALTTTGQIVGTSLYLAPERALGQPAGPASDIYSLGCVLYQLLAGQPPFRSDTATGTLYQHVDAVPVPPRRLGVDMPGAFETYLVGLLAKQPGDRPTAEQVADWFRWDSWRGRPQPLPPPLPQSAPAQAPASVATPPPVTGPRPTPATTYALPSVAGARVSSRHRPRTLLQRRPLVTTGIAGAVAFVASVLVGMVWFSPGDPPDNLPTAPAPPAELAPSTEPTPSADVLREEPSADGLVSPTVSADGGTGSDEEQEAQDGESQDRKRMRDRHDRDDDQD
ncbi:serine/threonine-protein kinase [Streptomyces sp. NPDC096176]|uniref:serine/threonine-protein kinase n=1 Tax=Streptomyces sp. NPDC096176 TaxID=3366079 RepID=UPI0037F2C240